MSKHEFELDLTSVCVGSGTVQLPLKVQALFVAGDVPAIVDGEKLLLGFVEPRRLSGFREHFEKRALRSNDRLRFELDIVDEHVVALVATSIKRERSKPSQQRSQYEPGSEADAQTGASQHPMTIHAASSWDSVAGGQVRAVRRIRIEGGTPAPVSPATRNVADGAPTPPHVVATGVPSAGSASASTGATGRFGGWKPLDGLTRDQVAYHPAHTDYPETTVREIRRSTQLVVPPSAGDEQGVAPALMDASDQLHQRRDDHSITPTPTDQPVPAPRIPVPRNTAPGSSWQPAPEAGLAPVARAASEGSAAVQQPRLIEERECVPAQATEAPTAGAAARWHAPRQQPAVSAAASESAPATPRPVEAPATLAPNRSQQRASALRAIDDAELGGEYLPGGRALETALRQASPGAAATVGSAPVSAAAEPKDMRSAVVELERHVDHDVAVAPEHAPVAPRVEDDIRLLATYLSRPNTPAIVRSEVVASELGIDVQRSERALERLSEDRDRVSRIRKGAYMVKSVPVSRSQGH